MPTPDHKTGLVEFREYWYEVPASVYVSPVAQVDPVAGLVPVVSGKSIAIFVRIEEKIYQ